MVVTAPTAYEQTLWSSNLKSIAGTDEVGRGAWAGSLVVAAVIFPPYFTTSLPINDSKKLSPKLRETLATEIKTLALCYSIIEIGLDVINSVGIGQAAQQGFFQAITTLTTPPDHILVDAFTIKELPTEKQTPIIKGDSQSLTIAAASILAKVHRDNLMQDLHRVEPGYGFDKNVGYGTASHRAAIKEHGLSVYHRTSYSLSKWA